MTTITNELIYAMKSKGLTADVLASLVGLTSSTFSFRKRGRVHWELEKCYMILDILEIPRNEIYKYFVGGSNQVKKTRQWR
jgi:DNA-binding XRE family transcriptional regulator